MNKEILQEWIQVLQTTDKKQGDFALKQNLGYKSNSDGPYAYCCLGILCEDVLKLKSQKIEYSSSEYFDGSADYIPSSAALVLELTSANIKPFNVQSDWTINITLTAESYNRGMEESKDFVSGVEKINDIDFYDNDSDDDESLSERLENKSVTFTVDYLNDTYKLTFKEIAAFLKYADRVG